MMFQEVNFYDEFWKPELEKLGYDSVYKSNDVNEFSHGCAIFYKSERFEDIECILIWKVETYKTQRD